MHLQPLQQPAPQVLLHQQLLLQPLLLLQVQVKLLLQQAQPMLQHQHHLR
jgi:hypothetical protein